MIAVCEPLIKSQEIKNVLKCLNTGWISSKGKFVETFEKKFAEFCGVKYGVTTTSGTTALHLALLSLEIGKGDEVIVPVFTMIATVNAVLYNGAKPVFIDIDKETFNIDTSAIEKKVTKKTKAIIIVHIYGHPVDMQTINKLAKKYKLFIIEDASEAHGAEYKGKKTGSLGDIGCFSFYANKIITTGEGGIIVTNNKKIYERAKSLKDLCHANKQRFLHTELGYNYRMTNIQCAIGLAQLERIKKIINKKRKIAKSYNKYLAKVKGITLPKEKSWAKNVYWMYAILVENNFGKTRKEVQKKLFENKIETRPFFIPMDKQPFLRKMGLISNKDTFPKANEISKKGLYLPSGITLKIKDIKYIANSLKEISLHK